MQLISVVFLFAKSTFSTNHDLVTHTHTTILRPSWILSGTTRVSWHQKGKNRKVKPIWIYWNKIYWVAVHQLGHLQICTLTQTYNHASHHSVFYRLGALPATQPTVSKQETVIFGFAGQPFSANLLKSSPMHL